MSKPYRHILLIGFMCFLITGCELLNAAAAELDQAGLGYLMPRLTLDDTVLLAYPSGQDLAAYYCPDVVPFPGNAGCSLLGPRPSESQMQFHFELRYLIDNPNPDIPIPATEILASIRLFEGEDSAELGAVCVALCNEGDVSCVGQPGENSCKSDQADITSVDDLQESIVGLLILTVDEVINGDFDNFSKRLIPAGAENFEVRVRFSLGADAMIDILGRVLTTVIAEPSELLAGSINIDIPFSVSGTLWFEIPVLGRVELGYGPFTDQWALEIPSFKPQHLTAD